MQLKKQEQVKSVQGLRKGKRRKIEWHMLSSYDMHVTRSEVQL